MFFLYNLCIFKYFSYLYCIETTLLKDFASMILIFFMLSLDYLCILFKFEICLICKTVSLGFGYVLS